MMPVANTQSDSASFSRVHCSTLDRMLYAQLNSFLNVQLKAIGKALRLCVRNALMSCRHLRRAAITDRLQ